MAHVAGTPASRTVGRLRVDVSLGQVARMFAAEQWLAPANAGGGAVFDGRVGEVVENVAREPHQEAAQGGVFNLDAHVHDVESGHPVPYLDVRVQVLRGGEPVLPELALVPVARPHKGVAGLHYGNNVALDPHGAYRVLLRVAPGALTGIDAPAEIEFEVDFGRSGSGG